MLRFFQPLVSGRKLQTFYCLIILDFMCFSINKFICYLILHNWIGPHSNKRLSSSYRDWLQVHQLHTPYAHELFRSRPSRCCSQQYRASCVAASWWRSEAELLDWPYLGQRCLEPYHEPTRKQKKIPKVKKIMQLTEKNNLNNSFEVLFWDQWNVVKRFEIQVQLLICLIDQTVCNATHDYSLR